MLDFREYSILSILYSLVKCPNAAYIRPLVPLPRLVSLWGLGQVSASLKVPTDLASSMRLSPLLALKILRNRRKAAAFLSPGRPASPSCPRSSRLA